MLLFHRFEVLPAENDQNARKEEEISALSQSSRTAFRFSGERIDSRTYLTSAFV
jgi:hypothetical protein